MASLYQFLAKIIIAVLAFIAFIFVGKKWGQATEQKKQAEDEADKMEKYEKIDSLPPVDNPFDRMRNDK
jgi:phosphotransferase system  glucose/maltose/N-acetylglucosamine-specific IIC component